MNGTLQETTAEARVFSRYLLKTDPAPEMIDRYVAAHDRLFTDGVDPGEKRIVEFARRHPWAVGPLDAASGILQPQSVLRKKILVMAAILEASPRFIDSFLPETCSPVRFFLRMAYYGIVSGVNFALGLPMLAALGRPRP